MAIPAVCRYMSKTVHKDNNLFNYIPHLFPASRPNEQRINTDQYDTTDQLSDQQFGQLSSDQQLRTATGECKS